MSDVPTRLREALADRYRIERELGQGGMATVYLAEDIKHERRVAIKVLKPELAAVIGAERFVTEIKTTAALQHPHILPLFDSGEAGGFLYYVMPYIEGETLRDRLDRERQLPVEESIRLARAVADALDYAHRHEVIHRDIKPENILLHEGNPVVADFGIALAISAAGGGRLTETGLSLGTPHYMSPEQATADRDLTARSDVYSLGCVLYEMLAGDPPHTGPSAQAILMRILTEDPRPVTDQRRSVPPNVAAAIAKALEKLPADRFESAAALGEALQDRTYSYTAPQRAATAPAAAAGPSGAGDRGSWWRDVRSIAAIALLVVAIATLGFALRPGPEEPPPPVVRAPFWADFATVAMSHDGATVAYTRLDQPGLWLQRLDQQEPRRVTEELTQYAIFSPDDEWLAFAGEGALKRVAVGGGSPITITDVPSNAFSPDWGDDGTVLYATLDGTYAVPWTGEGEPERVLDGGLFINRFARFLPGSRAIIYTEHILSGESGRIRLLDLESGEDTVLVEDGLDARYVPTGHLLYARTDQTLIAVPFDLERRRVTGSEVSVLDSVGVSPFIGIASFAVSGTGTAVYSLESAFNTAPGEGSEEVVLVEDGIASPIGLQPGSDLAELRISSDGRHLAYMREIRSFVFDLVVGTNTPLSSGSGALIAPIWRPDGGSLDGVGFGGGAGIFNQAPRSDAEPVPVVRPPESVPFLAPLDWTGDGRVLLMDAPGTQADLWTLTIDGDTTLAPYLDSDWDERDGRISPDDAWVAYVSNQEGEPAVYVRSFPEPGLPVRVSPGVGEEPRWSPAGDRLYWRHGDSVFVADVSTDDGFSVDGVRFLFAGPYENDYDVMPDGRFLMVRRIEPEPSDEPAEASDAGEEAEDTGPKAFIVVNWFEEMKARLGGGRQ